METRAKRVRVAEVSDPCHAYSFGDNGRRAIYGGTLSATVEYARTYMDRESVMDAWNITSVEVVMNGNVITTFKRY